MEETKSTTEQATELVEKMRNIASLNLMYANEVVGLISFKDVDRDVILEAAKIADAKVNEPNILTPNYSFDIEIGSKLWVRASSVKLNRKVTFN